MKSNSPPAGETTRATSEVDAKGGTDRPKNMPVVLIVSMIAALVGMGAVWGLVFS